MAIALNVVQFIRRNSVYARTIGTAHFAGNVFLAITICAYIAGMIRAINPLVGNVPIAVNGLMKTHASIAAILRAPSLVMNAASGLMKAPMCVRIVAMSITFTMALVRCAVAMWLWMAIVATFAIIVVGRGIT